MDRGDHDQARADITAMFAELQSHWVGEETGLFAVMARDDRFAEHPPLVREHRELAEF